MRAFPAFRIGCCAALLAVLGTAVSAKYVSAQDDGGAGVVDFVNDIKPILESKCLQCHGPDEAKNDFRVDDSTTMLSYIEPGDLESSSLWNDYLVTDDPDMRMPPADENDEASTELTGSQLATIRVWIEEGAHWPEDEQVVVEEEVLPASDIAKGWRFQGLFHPASVHFPVALLTVSALFVFLSFFNKAAFEPVAYHCLWIGALGAIVACITGWSYAQYQGYGPSFSFDLENSGIDRHRWLGVLVAVLAAILVPMSRSVRRTGDLGMRLMWFVGSLFLVVAVSTAGYQGGELTYGEDHYIKEFERLFPPVTLPAGDADPVTESAEDASEAEPDEAANEDAAANEVSSETNSNQSSGAELPSSEAAGTTDVVSESVPAASTETPSEAPQAGDSEDVGQAQPAAEDPSEPDQSQSETPPPVFNPAPLEG